MCDDNTCGWYKNLLELMDYGDKYIYGENSMTVCFKGQFVRLRAGIYVNFLLKYGVSCIFVNKEIVNDEEIYYIKTSMDDLDMMNNKIYSTFHPEKFL